MESILKDILGEIRTIREDVKELKAGQKMLEAKYNSLEKYMIEGFREIKEQLNEHSKILDEHTRILNEHSRTLDEHTRILNEHSRTLDEHTQILNEHSRTLDEHTRILNEHSRTLDEHTRILEQHTKMLQQHSNTLQRHEEYTVHLVEVTDVIQTVVTKQHDNHEKRISKLERIVGFN